MSSLFPEHDTATLEQSNASYAEQLMGDRLTAEFHSPMNQTNLRRKLRHQSSGASLWQDPEQLLLAEDKTK